MMEKRKSLVGQKSRSRSSSQHRSNSLSNRASRDHSPSEAPSVLSPSIARNVSPIAERIAAQSLSDTIQRSTDAAKIKEIEKENEELKSQAKDWQEKTEALVAKRRQDREALKDAERNRIQLQSFEEFKTRIMDQQKQLQKELREERKHREELADDYDRFREDMGDSAETIEMMTLDKEMAEEQAEILRAEADDLKIKLEEAETDLALLREEAEAANSDSDNTGVAPMQMKLKDEEIKRLKDALVKFRDLNNEEKHAAVRAIKQNKADAEELAINKRLVIKLEDQNKDLIEQVEELKEQVDLALGAEEMVETLTTRTLDLEEKLQEESERANDLDELHELDNEMAEVARDKELELREEIDLNSAKLRELTKLLEAERAHVADLNDTISKFRAAMVDQKGKFSNLHNQGCRPETNASGNPIRYNIFTLAYNYNTYLLFRSNCPNARTSSQPSWTR